MEKKNSSDLLQIIEIIKETHNDKPTNAINQELLNFTMIVLYKRQLKIDTNCRSKDIFYNTILQLYNTYPEIILYIIIVTALSLIHI